jgi:hypothetical protein
MFVLCVLVGLPKKKSYDFPRNQQKKEDEGLT